MADLSGFMGQCVAWVRTVLPWVPAGPQYAAGYATALPQAGATRIASSQAAAGDVVVFAPGQAGADSTAGHIAVVVSNAAGNLTVSQSNWADDLKPSLMTIPAAVASTLDVFSPPASQQASSAAAATQLSQGLPTASNWLGSQQAVVAGGGSTTTSSTDTGLVIHGPLGANWQILSGSALHRIGFSLAALAAIGVGLLLIFRREAESAGAAVAKAA